MERELWPALYQVVRKVGRQVLQNKVSYQPWVVATVLLWAALHDRPRCWACDVRNWSTTSHKPLRLPSPSVLSRRGDSLVLNEFWRVLGEALRGTPFRGLLMIVDGKPLFVGGCSKDPDAKCGFGAGHCGVGYKIHAIWSNHRLPEAWDVTPMNCQESVVAARLLSQVSEGGYLLGDGNYDTNPLHEAAGRHGCQLVAKDRRPNSGKSRHPQSPGRRRDLEVRHTRFGEELLGHRNRIETIFAHATNFPGGLAPLPNWVRRLDRIRTWIWCKLLINAIRIQQEERLAA